MSEWKRYIETTDKKFRFWLIGTSLLIVVFVWNGILRTASMWVETDQTEQLIAEFETQSASQRAERQSLHLNSEGFDLQESILTAFNSYETSSEVDVVKLTSPQVHVSDDIIVHTSRLILTGAYNDLIRMVEHLENELNGASVISLEFHKQSDPVSRGEELRLTLFIQALIQ